MTRIWPNFSPNFSHVCHSFATLLPQSDYLWGIQSYFNSTGLLLNALQFLSGQAFWIRHWSPKISARNYWELMRNWGDERLVSLSGCCRLTVITADTKEAIVACPIDGSHHDFYRSSSLGRRCSWGNATLDESDWQWLGKLWLTKEWREKERQAAITVEMSTIVDKFSHEAITLLQWYIST